MIGYVIIGIVVALGLLVLWLYTGVARGARARDRKLLARLAPVAERFEAGAPASLEEIDSLAEQPELRPMLYSLLARYKHQALFPRKHLAPESQAESTLVYWMLHPNELRAAPATIERVGTFERALGGKSGAFHVFRYKMPAGHWAGSEWILGLAGPYFPGDEPYRGIAAGFSRSGDAADKISPEALVDRYVNMLKQKGVAV